MKTTIVIVLYKVKVTQSTTLNTLMNVLMNDRYEDINVVIYDNGPENQQQLIVDKWKENIRFSYTSDPRNRGISEAYNYAYAAAKKNNSEWLLLLDHDTAITNEYFDELINKQNVNANVAAVVPRIISEEIMISPVYSDTLRPLIGDKPTEGLQERPIMAINSGALIRLPFLDKIGGFTKEFQLDYLDHWLFHKIFEKGYTVLVLNSILEHELSVLDYKRVSLQRYKSIIDSEFHFYKNYKKNLYKAYKKQLFKRLIKQVLIVQNKRIALYTLQRLLSE
ncbi:glycosyltransferase [Robertmurraya yapensis]|uniref:Glycosyltransferase n=1 Tax=Bacillus yapensis TaxID=2492960 RepID=A0A431WMB7_9BACI|nr:glycosyltransferase [Bacillus yapensis]RTR36405.1 glycosyltransferase [Bacillus yapensis]TKT05909.1 glycosyltransferase [Bacillus yapensis]